MGRLETTGFLRLSLRESFATDDEEQPLTINNFYYDATYGADVWETVLPDGQEIIPGHVEIRLTVLAPALADSTHQWRELPDHHWQLVSQHDGHRMAEVEYIDSTTLTTSMGVQNDVTTRVGICTAAVYENTGNFRYLIEYNNKGLNGGIGFQDAVASGTVVITFSRIFAPRAEFFGQSSSAMAFRDPEMATLIRQRLNSSTGANHSEKWLGVISNVFGQSSYLPGPSGIWKGNPIAFSNFDENGGCLGARATRTSSEQTGTGVSSRRFSQADYPLSLQHGPFSGLRGGVHDSRDLRRIRVRILAADETLYPLHGRELSLSVLLTTNRCSNSTEKKILQAYTKRKNPHEPTVENLHFSGNMWREWRRRRTKARPVVLDIEKGDNARYYRYAENVLRQMP